MALPKAYPITSSFKLQKVIAPDLIASPGMNQP